MADKLQVQIITPSNVLFEGSVADIMIPGKNGLINILPNHADIVLSLGVGIIKVKKDGTEPTDFICFGGILKLVKNNMTILADEVHLPTEDVLKEIEDAIQAAKQGTPVRSTSTADLIRAEKQLRFYLYKK